MTQTVRFPAVSIMDGQFTMYLAGIQGNPTATSIPYLISFFAMVVF